MSDLSQSPDSNPYSLGAYLSGLLCLLEATLLQLEMNDNGAERRADRLWEARLDLDCGLADLRALEARGSSHAAKFGLQLNIMKERLAAVERAAALSTPAPSFP